MKLESDVRIKRDVLKKLNKELGNTIEQRQKEIRKTKELYDLKNEQLKVDQSNAQADIRENFNKEFLDANNEKLRKLEHYQTTLKRDKELMDREREILTVRNDSQMKNMLEEYNQNFRDRYQEAHLRAQKIHDDTQHTLNTMDANTKFEIQESNRLSKMKSDDVVRRNENTLEKQRSDYSTLLHQTKIENAANLAKEKMRFEKEMRRIYQLQAGEASVQESTHAKQLAKKEEFYNRMILQKERGFKNKLAKLIEAQNQVLKNLRDKFQVEVNKVVAEMTKKKAIIQNKGQDSFYQIRRIDPKIVDQGKFYTMKLDIPHHEKEGVTLNASNRELRINFQRKFAGDMVDEFGNLNKSKRNELFTKVIQTEDILDPNGIRAKYNNKTQKLEVVLKKA